MKVAVDGAVAILTFDRPAKRNALSEDFVDEMTAAVVEVESRGCTAGVLQAEGSVFSAGADRAAVYRYQAKKAETGMTPPDPVLDGILRLKSSPVYWTAAVQGAAVGAGVSLVCACASAFATRDSWLSVPEIDYGLFPAELLKLLVPLIGRRRAFELAVTGRRIMADEALAIGLVSGVADTANDVQALALETARRIAGKGGFATDASDWWSLLGQP
jgi:methylglutaconyl-CoA hydratase